MISSNQDYRNAMKEMIRKVQSGYEPSFNASDEELELLSDCIKEGYIRGRTTYIDGNGHEPVSYTHLDVYKRQAVCSAAKAMKSALSIVQFQTGGAVPCVAVSYTHLDVYKRQL